MPRLRFPGFEGEWPLTQLSKILHERKTYAEKDGSYPHATLSKEGIYGKTDRYDRDFLVSTENKEYKITLKNDLCYNPANLKFGVICLNTFGSAIFSPIYVTFEIDKAYSPEFVGASLTQKDFIRYALRFQEGTVYERMAVSPEDLLSISRRFPSIAEQTKIAQFVSLIDSRIAAQRKLVELLKKHKRGLVQDLFTGELSKLPRRRFAGFKDALISRSFDEVFSFLKNNTLPRSEMTTAGGMIRNVHYGDVLIKYGDVLDCNRNQIPFLVGDKQSDDCRFLQDGDVVIADTAEDEAVGKAVELVGVANKLIESGLHTIAFRPKIPFAPRFLGYYLNSTAYRRQLLPLMQGIKVLSLSKSQLGKTQLLFPPDINEQKRIAELLTGIDAHIAVAQSHLDKMQSLKTGFLQQLFV